jgi:hypothetical protein
MVWPQLWNSVGVRFANQEERQWNLHKWMKSKKWHRHSIHRVWITKVIRQGVCFKSLPSDDFFFWTLEGFDVDPNIWNLKRVAHPWK